MLCSVLQVSVLLQYGCLWYILALESPYSHEVQQDTPAAPQLSAPYGAPPVQQLYGPAGETQATSPSHSGQQMPVSVNVSSVPSAIAPGQPASVSHSQPAVSMFSVSHCLH